MLVFEYVDAILIAVVIMPAVTFCQTVDLPVHAADLVPEVFYEIEMQILKKA